MTFILEINIELSKTRVVKYRGSVVQRVDNFIQRINTYPVDKFARCPIKIKNAPILSAG